MRADIAVLRREVTHDRGLDQQGWPKLTTARPVLKARGTPPLVVHLPPTAPGIHAQSGTITPDTVHESDAPPAVTPQDVIPTQDVIITAICNTIYARCNKYAKCNNFYARCNNTYQREM